MDLHAAKTAFGVLLEHLATHGVLKDWQQNTYRAHWGDPASDDWKYPRADLPVVIDAKGEEAPRDVQRKVWWDRLVKESDDNLQREDAAASLIQAVMRGRHARKYTTDALRVEMLSELENYRFRECHGGC